MELCYILRLLKIVTLGQQRGPTMQRREFNTLFGSAVAASVAACPLPANAQQIRRVGVLMSLTRDDAEDQVRAAAFEDGLKALGWVDGR